MNNASTAEATAATETKTEETFLFRVEYTDTFGGEANYSWVRRDTINAPDDTATIKRVAKRVMGLTGVRGVWTDIGETLEFRPRGSCTVLFVTPVWD